MWESHCSSKVKCKEGVAHWFPSLVANSPSKFEVCTLLFFKQEQTWKSVQPYLNQFDYVVVGNYAGVCWAATMAGQA